MSEDVPKRIGFLAFLVVLVLLASKAASTSAIEIIVPLEQTPYTQDVTKDVTKDFRDILIEKAYAQGLMESDIKILSAIIQAESSWRQYEKDGITPLTGRVHPADIGLCQINTAPDAHGPELERTGYDVNDPEQNLEFCVKLYKREGTKPWRASESNWIKYL